MPSPVHPYSDYGVALRTLRTARGWLGFLLLACVICQFVGFSLMFWTHHPYQGSKATWSWPANFEEARARVQKKPWPQNAAGPTTESAAAASAAAGSSELDEPFYPGTEQSRHNNVRKQWDTTYVMTVPLTQLAGLIAVSSQAIILFITLLVVLVAQAPGVAQLTRSVIWSVLLLFMFLPWQYFGGKDFPIPGVIYSYSELLRLIGPVVAHDPNVSRFAVFIVYARFIIWPLIGLLVLLITAERYRAGIMIAIGHPLQSMIQPRGGNLSSPLAVASAPTSPSLAGMTPRPAPPAK